MLRRRVCLLCKSKPYAAASGPESGLGATGRRQLSVTHYRSPSSSRGEPSPPGERSRVGTYIFAGAVSLAAGYAARFVTRRRREGKQKQQLDPEAFTPLTVTRNVMCTSPARSQNFGDGDHKLVELKLPSASATGPPPGGLSIWSIYVKQPDIQIERAYTPLDSPSQSAAHGALRLLVKRYTQGEMGRFIHLRGVGQELEIRGWCPTWDAKSSHPGKDIRQVYLVSDSFRLQRTARGPTLNPFGCGSAGWRHGDHTRISANQCNSQPRANNFARSLHAVIRNLKAILSPSFA